MGGQTYKYNYHYAVFNTEKLTDLLKKAGFREVRQWNPAEAEYHSFNDRSYRELVLNLEAVK